MNDNMSLTDRLDKLREMHTQLRSDPRLKPYLGPPDQETEQAVVVIMGPTTVLIFEDGRIEPVEGYTVSEAAETLFRSLYPVLVENWGHPDGKKP